jgi:sugar phosphate isomerase/epimerase
MAAVKHRWPRRSDLLHAAPVTELELWSYTFRHASLPELAAAAATAGFDAVTLTPDLFVRSGGDAADLGARVADTGIRVTFVDGLCTALPGTPPATARDRTFKHPHEATLDDCIHIARATGAGAINLVHIGGDATPVPQLAEAFARACARAAEDGLRLAIEFLPGTGIPDLATAVAVVRAAGAPNGSVLFDSWHFARGGGTLADLDAEAVAVIGALQLSDRSPDQDAEPYVPRRGRKLPGDGALPLTEMIARVTAAHPDLPVGAEVLSEEVDELGLLAGAPRIATALRQVVDAAARR